MRILTVGDSHGNAGFMATVFDYADQLDCDAVLQVGDFGYWPHTGWGLDYLDEIEALAQITDIPLWFIDGNHDNHDLLALLEGEELEVRGMVTYLPRGTRWEWGGVRFAALGGAYSIDQEWRTVGESWWPGEEITAADVQKLGRKGVDVLVCHDTPTWVPMGDKGIIVRHEEAARRSRALIDRAVDQTHPTLILSGHWHQRFTHRAGQVTVEVLAHDAEPVLSWLLLDCVDGHVTVTDSRPLLMEGAVHTPTTPGDSDAQDTDG